jgi:LacI family transcriptional regulator
MVPLDYLNIRLIEACYELDLHIPGDVALLGTGDTGLCTDLEMKFSSVRPGHHRLGNTAARMLLRMSEGADVAPSRRLIAPDGLSIRRSSLWEPRKDPLVARALDYLHGNPLESIDYEELWASLPASRRTVQRRFKAATGRTVRQEVRRMQLQEVRELLETTDLPLADIAARTGYEYVSNLCRAFKEATGLTPGEHRASCGDAGSARRPTPL